MEKAVLRPLSPTRARRDCLHNMGTQLPLFPKPSVSPLTPQGFTPSFAEHQGQHPSLCRLGRTRVGHTQHGGRGLRSPALSTHTTDPTTHHFRAADLLTTCPLVLKSDISLDVVIKNCLGISPASGAGRPSEIDHRGYKFPMSAWKSCTSLPFTRSHFSRAWWGREACISFPLGPC